MIQKLKKEVEQQQEETQKIDQKYQKMMQVFLLKSVKQVVQEYEDTIIATTPEFRDEPKIDGNIIPPPPEFRDEIKIAKVSKPLKVLFNHTRSASLMTNITT